MTALLDIDPDQIAAFVTTVFRYASPEGTVSLRAFHEGKSNASPWMIEAVVLGDSLDSLISAAVSAAHHAAMASKKIVFCPPLCAFNNPMHAREADLVEAYTLSVELDVHPQQSRERLEALLGPATLVVASGGEWTDPATQRIEPKLHVHWRTRAPVDASALPQLKLARKLAARLVDADPSNVTPVHPIRWAGSVHRKGEPRLATIVALDSNRDIDLADAVAILENAVAQTGSPGRSGQAQGARFSDYAHGADDDTAELIRQVMTGEVLHPAIVPLAARMRGRGMFPGAIVDFLRSLMNAIPVERRDARWNVRFDEIPRIVDSAEQFAPKGQQTAQDGQVRWAGEGAEASWVDPDLSLLDDRRGELPEFPITVLPESWRNWVKRAAQGAGVCIDHIVMPLLAIVAGLVGAARRIEAVPTWGERLGLWTTTVGFSGTGKTPGLNASKRVLEAVERDRADLMADLRRKHETRLETARAAYKRWKDDVKLAVANGATSPAMPPEAEDPGPYVEPRLYVSDTTVEKLAVLIKARPRGALVIVDELAGLFSNMNRYTNGSDREFWLTAWMGDSYVVERLSRTVRVQHLLVSMTGGFQPDKLSTAFKGDDDGMYARQLFSWPSKPPYRELSDEIRDIEPGIYNAFVRIVDLPAGTGEALEPRTLGFTTDAKVEFESFRYTHDSAMEALDGREREWWAKGPSQVLRLAGVLAFMEWLDPILSGLPGLPALPEPETVEAKQIAAAVTLWREYFWPHARACIRQIGLTERHIEARRALRWLRATNTTEVFRENVRHHACGRRLDADQAQDLIDRLVSVGWLRERSTATAGRPARRWEVNPILFTS